MKKEIKIEVEIMTGHWEEVELNQLTDEEEQNPSASATADELSGSFWYVDGNYSAGPKEIRVN